MFARDDFPDWSTDGADWPHRDRSAFVSAGGYAWHVQRMGEGPTAVLIHGTGAATHSWSALAPLLAAGHDVIAMDLPGHGFTRSEDGRRISLPNVATAIGALLKKLDVAPDLLVGHSAGAAIAARMALDGWAQPARIIGINAAVTPFVGAASILFPAMAKLMYLNPFTAPVLARSARDTARVERLIEQTGSLVPSEQVEAYAKVFRRAGHLSGTMAMMAFWDLESLYDDLPQLDVPMLFLAGERDRTIRPADGAAAARRVRNGLFMSLSDLGHLAHEEDADAVASEIKAFEALNDVEKSQ